MRNISKKISLMILCFLFFPVFSQNSGYNIYVAVHDSHNKQDNLKHSGIYVSRDLGNTWQNIGWKSAKIFKVLPFEENNGQVIFLAAGNGVHKTEDSGVNWKTTTGWDVTEVIEITRDPADDDIIYIGCAYGFCKSLDNGETWHYKNTGLKYKFVDAILVNKQNPDNLFAGTDRGLFISNNKGESWSIFAFEGISILTITKDPVDSKIIYLTTEDEGVFKSSDTGRTWKSINRGLHHNTIYDIAIDPVENNRIYAAAFTGGIYLSEDYGENWQQTDLNDRTVLTIDIHPFDRKFLVCGTKRDGVMISSDGGLNWTATSFSDAQIYDVKIIKVR